MNEFNSPELLKFFYFEAKKKYFKKSRESFSLHEQIDEQTLKTAFGLERGIFDHLNIFLN
jgi:hypothetical protein